MAAKNSTTICSYRRHGTTATAFLLMVFLFKALSQLTAAAQPGCNLSNIRYGVVRTGREVGGKTEWEVTISHTCTNCSMGNIVFNNCGGFRTAEPVNPALFNMTGPETCLVNQGRFLKPGESVVFKYAWDSPVIFVPAKADVRC